MEVHKRKKYISCVLGLVAMGILFLFYINESMEQGGWHEGSFLRGGDLGTRSPA